MANFNSSRNNDDGRNSHYNSDGRNSHYNDDRPKNAQMTIPMILDGRTDHGETYDVNQLIDILKVIDESELVKLISIPVYGNRRDNYDTDSKGTMVVGYLKGIDLEHKTLDVVVYAKYAEKYNTQYSGIKFRVIIDKREKYVRQILGIDIDIDSDCE